MDLPLRRRGAVSLVDEIDGVAVVRVHVQPRAGRTEVTGRHADALKIRVSAPPTEGRATGAAGEALAAALGVAKRRVELRSGASSRLKRFSVHGMSAAEVESRLGSLLG